MVLRLGTNVKFSAVKVDRRFKKKHLNQVPTGRDHFSQVLFFSTLKVGRCGASRKNSTCVFCNPLSKQCSVIITFLPEVIFCDYKK